MEKIFSVFTNITTFLQTGGTVVGTLALVWTGYRVLKGALSERHLDMDAIKQGAIFIGAAFLIYGAGSIWGWIESMVG